MKAVLSTHLNPLTRRAQFGVSNFTLDQVLAIHTYARDHNMVLPTIYQASYSPAVRLNETLLFPTLRDLGMSIQAYSPMAAGFLAKTPAQITAGVSGRWDPNTPSGAVHRNLFFKPSYLTMLEEYGELAEESGVGRLGLALRWVRWHGVLRGELGDEMLLGASKGGQLKEVLEEAEKGPLEEWVVGRLDELWEMVREDAPIDNLKAVRDTIVGLLKKK